METLSLNLARHIRASWSRTSAAGDSEKVRWVMLSHFLSSPLSCYLFSASLFSGLQVLLAIQSTLVFWMLQVHWFGDTNASLHNPPSKGVPDRREPTNVLQRIGFDCRKIEQLIAIILCLALGWWRYPRQNGSQTTERDFVYDSRLAPRWQGLRQHLSLRHLIEIFGRGGIDDSLSVWDNMETFYI